MTDTKHKVLLVDDDPAVLRSLTRHLEDHGFDVLTSTCAAVAGIILERDEVQAVVCDHNMPGQSGLEFLEFVRDKYPGLVMFILSGQVAGISVAEDWAREIGVTKIFSKPCNHSEIIAEIEMALSDRAIESTTSDA